MKLVADERVEGPTVERLRRDGHDVLYIAELDPGIADPWVLSFARAEKSILLTADKDYFAVKNAILEYCFCGFQMASLKSMRRLQRRCLRNMAKRCGMVFRCSAGEG